MKFLLVDDHTLFLEGLKNMLQANGLEVAGTVNDSRLALIQTEKLKPDVVLMDIQMPFQDGIETTKIIKGKIPSVKIVMLTVAQDDYHLFEAIKAGASGYLLKGMDKDKFMEMLVGIAHGESPLSPGLAGRIMEEFAKREKERETSRNVEKELSGVLTPRQVDVLRLVSQGLTYKEVAEKLDITEAAVKYHMGEITARLHLESRSQAMAYASEIGLSKGM